MACVCDVSEKVHYRVFFNNLYCNTNQTFGFTIELKRHLFFFNSVQNVLFLRKQVNVHVGAALFLFSHSSVRNVTTQGLTPLS